MTVTIEIPRYVLALFDGEGGDVGDGVTPPTLQPAAPAAPATPSRDAAGKFSSQADAERRVHELTESDKQRRLENKELKAALATTQKSVELSNQRAIRAEVRVALQAAGANHSNLDELGDIVDSFLKWGKGKVKVDDSSGEIVGLESVTEYKAARPSFFKAVTDALDGSKKDGDSGGKDGKKGDDPKPNATASGSSPAGGGSSAGVNTGGLPDLRKLTPEERKAALADYKRAQRGARGR